MTTPLRILHLEDSEIDRELVRRSLVDEQIICDFVYATSRAEFAEALDRETFDLILSDFTMPGYDGGSALALAQQKCPEVPYLFVSGTIGEERAIESLKGGATDYVLKDRLERLLPAVRRALGEASERAKRRVAEAALKRAEARFRDIVENAVEGIYQSTPSGRLLEANHAMARICGYASPGELCAKVQNLSRDLYAEPARRAEFVRILDERGKILAYESRIVRKDGAVVWISENARAVRGPEDEPLYYEGMVTDITARKTAEEALRRSEERFRQMAGKIDDVFYITSLDTGQWSYVSPAYEKIWGRRLADLYAYPQQWENAIVPGDRIALLAARERLARGEDYRVEYHIQRPDGSQRWIEDRGFLVRDATNDTSRVVGVAVDITQRRQLEAQLLQSQKMEAVGQLAGGVAHDFNNVLTVVIGYARLLLDGGTLPPDAVEPLSHIFTAGMRAANLTRQLLVFSRKEPINRRSIDLNTVAGEIADMLRRLIGEHIKFELTASQRPCLTEADGGMIQQVLMNLSVNARDAMPKGGALTISTSHVSIKDPATRKSPEARSGEFVSLDVRDTGCGIPPQNLQRIFEPFFTTKDVGRGTGLGLAMAYGIVQQHQGWIELESTQGVGTCFRILLPALETAAALPSSGVERLAPANRGTETLLLVEDEPDVREFAAAVLASYGYNVLKAATGVEALGTWRLYAPNISLVLTDVVMPDGLSGLELASQLRRERPSLRVVLTSGYAHEMTGEEFRTPAGASFIQKPYRPEALAQAVREALDAKTTS